MCVCVCVCVCVYGFPCGSDSKEFACNVGDLGSIPVSGGFPGKGMATHSSILVWRIPWTEEPWGLQSMGFQSQTRLNTHTHTHTLILQILFPYSYYKILNIVCYTILVIYTVLVVCFMYSSLYMLISTS